PATGQVIATATKSAKADVDRAVDAARRAFDAWRLFPAPKRGEILYRAGELMLQRKDDLAREMTTEMGKVLAEARGDVQEGIDMTYYTAGEGRRQFGDVVPAELPNKWAMSMRHPLGVVAAITPWNFPFAIPTWKIMPALVLGNAVVDLALEGVVWSAFGTSGQRCTAASRVIAHRGVANDLIDRLVGRAKKMKMGHGLDAGTDLGPVISAEAQQKVHSYIPI